MKNKKKKPVKVNNIPTVLDPVKLVWYFDQVRQQLQSLIFLSAVLSA